MFKQHLLLQWSRIFGPQLFHNFFSFWESIKCVRRCDCRLPHITKLEILSQLINIKLQHLKQKNINVRLKMVSRDLYLVKLLNRHKNQDQALSVSSVMMPLRFCPFFLVYCLFVFLLAQTYAHALSPLLLPVSVNHLSADSISASRCWISFTPL